MEREEREREKERKREREKERVRKGERDFKKGNSKKCTLQLLYSKVNWEEKTLMIFFGQFNLLRFKRNSSKSSLKQDQVQAVLDIHSFCYSRF